MNQFRPEQVTILPPPPLQTVIPLPMPPLQGKTTQPAAPAQPIVAPPAKVFPVTDIEQAELEAPRQRLWPAVSWWKHGVVIIAMIATIATAFSNAYQSGMTLDNKYIIEEYYKSVTKMYPDQDLLSWGEVGLLFTNDYWWPKGISGLYRPITSFTYWLDYVVLTGKAPKYDKRTGAEVKTISGPMVPAQVQGRPLSGASWKDYAWTDALLNTDSYHTINLAVHLTNAILIYFVCLALLKRVLPAAFVALLFAAHPITTESVTNIIGRADMFAAVCVFGGLLLYMRSTRSTGSWSVPWLVGLSLITAFGLFSKESAAAVILVVIAYDLIYRWRRDNTDLAGLPPLLGHGLVYLVVVGLAIGLPALASVVAQSNRWTSGMPITPRIFITGVAMSLGLGVYFGLMRADRWTRFLSIAGASVALILASIVTPFVPLAAGAVIAGFELCRASISSENKRYRVVAHSTLYLFLYFTLIALPIASLWIFHHLSWDPWVAWPIRYPAAATLLAGGLCIHFLTLRMHWSFRLIGLLAVAVLAVGASFFSYWMGIILALIVATHELILGTLTPREDEYRRDWTLIFNGFSAGYLVMLPPLIAMFVVRAWLFANNTPAEEPFLDNPIRGIWKVAELNMPSFEADLAKKPMPGMTFFECKMTAVKVMGKLMYLLVWPQTLCSDYSFDEFPNFSWGRVFGLKSVYQQYVANPQDEKGLERYRLHQWEDWKTVASLLTIVGLLGVAAYGYWHNRAMCFMILFFFAGALPTSNFIITIGSVMAERFMYLPLAGFTGLATLAIFAFSRKLWNSLKLNDPHGLGWGNALAGGFLSLVVCVFGARAYFRNFVWISDLTLWKDAIQTSTRAFRCYQSLAFALYEQDGVANVDQMISLDEQGLTIVDRLPNHLNSSRMYLHLGMYYQVKGDLFLKTENGEQVTSKESIPWYQKSIIAMERGAEIDRAFNELNRTKQLKRGDPAWRIADVGLTPVYEMLATAYIRLGNYDEAYKRLIYQRQMDPGDVKIYLRMAGIHVVRKEYAEAARLLEEAIFIDSSNQDVWMNLYKIYRDHFGAAGATAIVQEGTVIRLNPDGNPLVREHLNLAYMDLVKVFRRAHRWEVAAGARRAAVEVYHFDPILYDPLFDKPIEFVTPQGVSDKIDDKITPEDLKQLRFDQFKPPPK